MDPPSYHKKVGATPHPGACKHSLQYDGRPGGCCGDLYARTWNVGSLRQKGEVCEELEKRIIDVCCFQEVRWRGQDTVDERKKI